MRQRPQRALLASGVASAPRGSPALDAPLPALTQPGSPNRNSEGAGLRGVRDYIREHRQTDFIDTFIRKLLAYALNRSLELSDEPLVEEIGKRLASQGYRFEPLVEAIVASPQFRNQRNPNFGPEAKVMTRR